MKNYIITILLLFSSHMIYAQKPSTELVFDCLQTMALENSIQKEISFSEGGNKVVYICFDNQLKSFNSEIEPDLIIRTTTEEELFVRPISCYLKIKSVKQIGKKLFFEIQIKGEGNSPCKVKNGEAKIRISDQKLIQLKWL